MKAKGNALAKPIPYIFFTLLLESKLLNLLPSMQLLITAMHEF